MITTTTNPPEEVATLDKALTIANDAMKGASAELKKRSDQIEVALDALIAIVEGTPEPRVIAARAVLEMKRLAHS